MPEYLQDLSEPALIQAVEANLFALFQHVYGCLPNPVYQAEAEVTWCLSDLAGMLFNGVLHARFASEAIEARIQKTLAPFKAARKPMLWWTGPATRPTDLGRHLQAGGLLLADENSGMVGDLENLAPPGPANPAVTVKRVATRADLEKWAVPFAVNFELPRQAIPQICAAMAQLSLTEEAAVQHYLGYLHGEAVSTATFFLAAGVAGFYNISTLPKARRQGVGKAVTLAAMQAARARGYRIGILHSTEAGYNLYRQLGFRTVCTIQHYLYLPNPVQRELIKLLLGVDRWFKTLRPARRAKAAGEL